MIYKVNLLPANLQREGIIDVRRLLMAGSLTLLSAVVLGSYGIFLFDSLSMNSDLKETKQQLESLAPVIARVEAMRKERRDLEATLAEYNLITKKHAAWSDLLYDLGDIAPVDLWLVDMEILNKPDVKKPGGSPNPTQKNDEKGKEPDTTQSLPRPNVITFDGFSRTVPSVGMFINDLYKLPYFKEVKLNSVSDEKEGFKFKITAIVRNDL